MKINIILIFFFGTFLSCNELSREKEKENNFEEYQKLEQIVLSIKTNCSCYDGIGSVKGDKPISIFSFSNNQSVAICGHEKDKIISEFDIFTCKDGSSISRYDATQVCQVNFKNDTIEIIELKNLPSKNWEWELLAIGKELIILKDSTIKCIEQVPFFINPEISFDQQKEILDEIEVNKDNGLQHDWSWKQILAQLEVLSLMQNKRARNILFSIQEMTNYKFDGAIKEQYKDAIATVKWMEK